MKPALFLKKPGVPGLLDSILEREGIEVPPPLTLRELVEGYEEHLIRDTCVAADWNLSVVCRRLGVGRQSLYNKLKRYGIQRPQ